MSYCGAFVVDNFRNVQLLRFHFRINIVDHTSNSTKYIIFFLRFLIIFMIIQCKNFPLKITHKLSKKQALLLQIFILTNNTNINCKHSPINISLIISRRCKQTHLISMLQPKQILSFHKILRFMYLKIKIHTLRNWCCKKYSFIMWIFKLTQFYRQFSTNFI